MTLSRPHLPALLACAALVVAAYGASLAGGFVWDDRPLVADNPLVRDSGRLESLMTTGFWPEGSPGDNAQTYFRPLVSLTYALDHALWGTAPFGFRLTNLALHVACCWLIYVLVLLQGGGRVAAGVAGALFAVHPAHVESVAWISGRTDVVCCLFLLGSWIAHDRAGRSRLPGAARIASLVLFALALLSKEMAATLPILIVLERRLRGEPAKAAWRTAAPYFGVLLLYIVVRPLAMGPMPEPAYRLGFESFLATLIWAPVRYIGMLVAPVGVEASYWHEPIAHPGHWSVLGSAGLLAAGLVLLWRLRKTQPALCFWSLWILITLTPAFWFGRFGDAVLAERFLYIPSVGLALLAAAGIEARAPASLQAGAPRLLRADPHKLAAAALAAILVFTCAARCRAWADDISLFTSMSRSAPRSALVRQNLGLALQRSGQTAAAVDAYRRAIELAPEYALAHGNLGSVLESQGRLVEALRHYRLAQFHDPTQLGSKVNEAALLVRLGRVEEGLKRLKEAAQQRPLRADVLYAYAEALDRAGRQQEAFIQAGLALEQDPFLAGAHYLLAKIHYDRGRLPEAASSMRRFLELGPKEGPYAEVARRVVRISEATPAAR